ncbi:hypothetical protein P7C70_g8044, partial [Phenoliferia sp. Uapishka_3]
MGMGMGMPQMGGMGGMEMGMGGMMGMPQMGGMGYGYGAMPPSGRLPPFAPSMAASQQFFQQPNYAGSAIGFAPSSPRGGQPQGQQRRAPASTIGISPRR